MKEIFILLFLFLFVSANYSQTKYMIYFKDKGETSQTSLMKSSVLFETAAKELSTRAIERRKKIMGDEYITFDDLPIYKSYLDKIEELGIKISNKLKWFNAVSCYLSDEQFGKVKQFPFIRKIETVKILKSSRPVEMSNSAEEVESKLNKTTSLDYGNSFTQNALSEIPSVHDLGITGEGVLIGILDTGFRWKTHPSLQNRNVLAEHDFVFNDDVTENEPADTSTQDGHGTSVFSLMAGYDPGNLIGPSFGANYILAKTENVRSEKNIEEDNYAAAMEWFEAQGVDITSSSLGYSEFDDGQNSYNYSDMNGQTTVVAKAVNKAYDLGVSTFTAAGNNGNDSWFFISSPADAFNIITVGAVNSSNSLAPYSSRGPSSDGRIKPEVVSMGTSVRRAIFAAQTGVTVPSYTNLGNGTSFATPIAAGIAGLLKSAHPHLTNSQIRKIFLESGDNTASPNNEIGYGLISAKKAVSYPNLEMNLNEFILHKIFIDDLGVDSLSVVLSYKIDNSTFSNTTMLQNGKNKFRFSFPRLINGQHVEFYFTYNNLSGGQVREPKGNENYKFSYGSNQVSLFTGINETEELPKGFYLSQNYPNPFNPETVINYRLPAAGYVQLKIYDILGNEITTLVNGYRQPGEYKIQLSSNRIKFSSGVYFYQLTAGSFSETKKMILIK